MNAPAVIPIKRAHALLSPSSAAKWINCPGSIAQEKGLPEDEGNEYSDEGTCAHAVAAMALTESKPATAYIGRRIDVAPHRTYEFREDMAEPVQVYVDLVRSLVETTGGTLFVEEEVPIGHITGEEGATGTADTIIVTGDGEEIIGIDLKFGRGVIVDAEENPQLMLYALGTLEFLALVADTTKVKRFRMMVSQPRVSTAPAEWDCTIEHLREFADRASIAGSQALDLYYGPERSGVAQGAPVALNPGEKTCMWCRAKPTCGALAAYVSHTVGADFEVLITKDADPIAQEQVDSEIAPQGQPPASLAQKMAACDLIEDWIKAVRAEVERQLLAGVEVPGWKLVQGKQGNRAWTDKEAAEALLKSFRLKQEEMYDFSLISPTTAEKRLKDSPKRWTKAQALIGRAEGKPHVAPLHDKRPALVIKPTADEFAEVVEDLA